jgi:hypothetical protein
LPAIILPLIGILLMVLMITVPRWFQRLSALFAVYSLLILYLTA